MFVINLFTLLLSKKLMISQSKQDRVTIKLLQQMKSDGEKISMLTAYDYSFAKIIDNAGVDIILVGDSASNVMAGHETTLPITLDQMIYHASSVIRAIDRALVVVDLPFGSYQSDPKEALRSAMVLASSMDLASFSATETKTWTCVMSGLPTLTGQVSSSACGRAITKKAYRCRTRSSAQRQTLPHSLPSQSS